MAGVLTSTDVLIPLRDGPTVPTSIVTWLISAEDRGVQFHVAPDGRLRVGPPGRVTPRDQAFIRDHRDLIAACVVYCEREVPL